MLSFNFYFIIIFNLTKTVERANAIKFVYAYCIVAYFIKHTTKLWIYDKINYTAKKLLKQNSNTT